MDYLDLTYELKSLIQNDKRYLVLKEKEKIMEASEEVMALSYIKDVKETELSDALRHYSKDSEEVKKAHVELFKSSSKLDDHPLVQDYLKAYEEFNNIIKEVNDILFKDLKRKKCI